MPDWVCPRCKYVAATKQHILRHWTGKKVCKRSPDGVEILTDAIKKHVLEHHKYECIDERDRERDALLRRVQQLEATVARAEETIRQQQQQLADYAANTTNAASPPPQVVNINVTNTINVIGAVRAFPPPAGTNNFGQEHVEHIIEDNTLMTECVKDLSANGVPKLVKQIYFDAERPENHTVKLDSGNRNTFLVHSDGTWEPRDKDTTLVDMMYASVRMLIKASLKISGLDHYDLKSFNFASTDIIDEESMLHDRVKRKVNDVVYDNAAYA